MPEQSQIVVGYDFSHSGHAALDRAFGVVMRAPWHVLHIVCVIHPRHAFPLLPAKHVDIAYADEVQQVLTDVVASELAERYADDRVRFFVHARIGKKPADEILGVAEDVGADLIIVGSKGLTGLERAMLGSTSERIAREARCTVEVARPRQYKDVPRLEMVDNTEAHHHYAPPHRYHYEDLRATRRPDDWPLY